MQSVISGRKQAADMQRQLQGILMKCCIAGPCLHVALFQGLVCFLVNVMAFTLLFVCVHNLNSYSYAIFKAPDWDL